MLFIHNPKLRKLEAFMQEVPNFPPKYGERVYKELEEQILLLSIEKAVMELKKVPFMQKTQYLYEGNEDIMKFRNEQHRSTFLKEIKSRSFSNYKLIAALYLLTADSKLWDTAKEFVGKEDIDFESIHLKSGSENAYALFCAAKDLYNGSRHLAIDDIADVGLIKNKVFTLICNAMLIKRKGLTAVITMKNCDCGRDEG